MSGLRTYASRDWARRHLKEMDHGAPHRDPDRVRPSECSDRRHRRVDCRAVLGHGRRCELPGPFGTSTASSTTTLKSGGQRRGPLGPEHQRDGRNVRARALDHRAFRPGADHRQLQRRQGDELNADKVDGIDSTGFVRAWSLRGARSAPAATGVRLPGQRCSGRLRLGQPRLRLQHGALQGPAGVVHLKGVVSPLGLSVAHSARSTFDVHPAGGLSACRQDDCHHARRRSELRSQGSTSSPTGA